MKKDQLWLASSSSGVEAGTADRVGPGKALPVPLKSGRSPGERAMNDQWDTEA